MIGPELLGVGGVVDGVAVVVVDDEVDEVDVDVVVLPRTI